MKILDSLETSLKLALPSWVTVTEENGKYLVASTLWRVVIVPHAAGFSMVDEATKGVSPWYNERMMAAELNRRFHAIHGVDFKPDASFMDP